ncbi:Golgi phosphoprotein 3 GPP34 [Asanoa ferruginea]|uniref:Golgi phosphoprotein 3 GPP34 n=1 Tax=Asanoa ferruginea TaxID=53367 RepID=A0A3D9ZFJ0_9ACTN|nr:MAB_1171c family putative transporter [Asanoa ferruginea]REF94603.1 Golgi phosphoprotein 3 GPP34 [Asanoa ferruginea]
MSGIEGLLVAAFIFVVLAHKSSHLYRDPGNPALRAMCLTLVCLMTAIVIGFRPIYQAIDQAAGVPNLTRYLAHALALVAAAAIQTMFLFLADPATAPARTRRRWFLLAATLGIMGSAFLWGHFNIEDPEAFTARYAHRPEFLVYLAAFLAFCAVGTADVLRMSMRYAHLVPARHLRLGIRLLAVGVVGGVLFGLHKLVVVVVSVAGLDVPWSEPSASRALALFSIAVTTAGLAAPSLGPYVADAIGWTRHYRLYRDLEPLWKAIYRVSQSAVLSPPRRRPSVGDMRLQLDRRVIEIHDGLRELSPYVERDVAEEATKLALLRGAQVDHARAIGQAASLAAAIGRMTAVSADASTIVSRNGGDGGVLVVGSDAGAQSLALVSRVYAGEGMSAGPRLARYRAGRRREVSRAPMDDVPLAGVFYLLAHDAETGRARLRPRATAVTLAAGLLMEVLFLNLARIEGKELIAADGPAPRDPLIREVAQAIAQETHTVRTWLEYLSETALEDVIQRLHGDGIIAPMVARSVFRTMTVWRPTEPGIVASSWGRLSLLLRTGAQLAPLEAALAGLIHVAELDSVLLAGAERPVREHLAGVLQRTASPLQLLLAETQTILGADVLARRI